MPSHVPERVLVFGATSRVAQEVVLLHAARGDRLHLVARSEEKLEAFVRRAGIECSREVADLTRTHDAPALVARASERLGGIDRVLIAQGELGDQAESERSIEAAERALLVNLTSAVALLVPLGGELEARRAGRIGVITSVAGERGRPRNYTYGAAKGGLSIYLEGLRSRLVPAGVSVTTIKLGPVDTPMTVEHEKNALFSQPEDVAKSIVRAMDRRAGNVFVPGYWALVLFVVRLLPEFVFQRLRFLSGR